MPCLVDCCRTISDSQSGNSTIGNNGKFYFHTSNQQGFNGNQYVKVARLKNIGNTVKRYTGPVGKALDIIELKSGVSKDLESLERTGCTNLYNTSKASASVVGSYLGASYGSAWGAKIGFAVGSTFGGIGAIPGTILGSAIGGICGAYVGSYYSEQIKDYVYGK